MPIGGKLVLKGGQSLKGSVKKTKHKKSKAAVAAVDEQDDQQQHIMQHEGEEGAPQGAQPGVCSLFLIVLHG